MANADSKPTRVRWVVFSLTCGASWLLYLHRYAFALIKPYLKQEWNLSSEQLGWLDTAFYVPYMLFQVPLGIAADVWGTRLVLTQLMVIWTIGIGAHAAAHSITALYGARALLGLGQSAAYATLTRLSRNWYPPAIRTTLQGLANVLAGRIGGLSANLLFATVLMGLVGLSWRSATYVFTLVGLGLAWLVWIMLRNTPRDHPWVNTAEASLIAGSDAQPSRSATGRVSFGELIRGLDRRRKISLVAIHLQTLLSTVADNIYSNWLPLFLAEVYHFRSEKIGLYAALPLLGGAVAGVLGGALNDACLAWTGNRRWSRSGVALVGKGLAAVILFAALFWYESPYTFCGLLFFVKLFGDWSLTTMTGVITDIGGRATASVYAFNNALATVAMIFAAPLYGAVADRFGWPWVFGLVAATYVLCALSWLAIDCTLPLLADESSD